MSDLMEVHGEMSEFIKKNWKSSLKQPTGNLK